MGWKPAPVGRARPSRNTQGALNRSIGSPPKADRPSDADGTGAGRGGRGSKVPRGLKTDYGSRR